VNDVILMFEDLKSSFLQYFRDDFRLEVHHVLSQDPGWSGLKGRISANLLQDLLSENLEDLGRMVCICGPLPFTETAHR